MGKHIMAPCLDCGAPIQRQHLRCKACWCVSRPALQRFWEKVQFTPGGCWLWTGAIDRYGRFWNGQRVVLAHVYAYETLVGPVPEGMELDHLCRNRPCVNPRHLEPVTHQVNSRRGEAGINNRSKTHCVHGHPFDDANTYIRPSTGQRVCRACWRERAGAKAA